MPFNIVARRLTYAHLSRLSSKDTLFFFTKEKITASLTFQRWTQPQVLEGLGAATTLFWPQSEALSVLQRPLLSACLAFRELSL